MGRGGVCDYVRFLSGSVSSPVPGSACRSLRVRTGGRVRRWRPEVANARNSATADVVLRSGLLGFSWLIFTGFQAEFRSKKESEFDIVQRVGSLVLQT